MIPDWFMETAFRACALVILVTLSALLVAFLTATIRQILREWRW